jgi:hypothetical protein
MHFHLKSAAEVSIQDPNNYITDRNLHYRNKWHEHAERMEETHIPKRIWNYGK